MDEYFTLPELIEKLDLRERESSELDRAARNGEIDFTFEAGSMDSQMGSVFPNALTTSNFVKKYSLPAAQAWLKKTGGRMVKVLVPLATGFEEIEAVCIIDILRRAGVEVRTAGLQKGPVMGAHHISLIPDLALVEAVNDTYTMICLPGGQPGTMNLKESFILGEAIKKCYQGGGIIAAICAAPTVIAGLGLAPGSKITSFPSEKGAFKNYSYQEDAVVEDNRLITSRGAGTAVVFALKLVERLVNKETAEKIRAGIIA